MLPLVESMSVLLARSSRPSAMRVHDHLPARRGRLTRAARVAELALGPDLDARAGASRCWCSPHERGVAADEVDDRGRASGRVAPPARLRDRPAAPRRTGGVRAHLLAVSVHGRVAHAARGRGAAGLSGRLERLDERPGQRRRPRDRRSHDNADPPRPGRAHGGLAIPGRAGASRHLRGGRECSGVAGRTRRPLTLRAGARASRRGRFESGRSPERHPAITSAGS